MATISNSVIAMTQSTLKKDIDTNKSIWCSMVLRLMDAEEYSCNYCRALDLVLSIFPEVDRASLEKELDKYI